MRLLLAPDSGAKPVVGLHYDLGAYAHHSRLDICLHQVLLVTARVMHRPIGQLLRPAMGMG